MPGQSGRSAGTLGTVSESEGGRTREITSRQLDDVIAENVRRFREERGLSQDGLASAMRTYGIPWTKTLVGEIESRRRRRITTDELFALTFVYDTKVAHLLIPEDRSALIEVSSVLRLPISELVSLIGGNVRPSPLSQPKLEGPIGELVRLRKERSQLAGQIERAEQVLTEAQHRYAMAVAEMTAVKARLTEVSAELEQRERTIAEDQSDPFAFMIEQHLADQLGIDLGDVIQMAVVKWGTNARDEVNRRAAILYELEEAGELQLPILVEGADEPVTVRDDRQYTEITGGVMIELNRALRHVVEGHRRRTEADEVNDIL